MSTINAEDVAWAIEIANKVRAAKGEQLLGDKLPYTTAVGSPSDCVLARAFNFDCRVGGPDFFDIPKSVYSGDAWLAEFTADKKDIAHTMANAIGMSDPIKFDLDDPKHGISYGSGTYWYVELPNQISAIALAFDNDTRELFPFMEGDHNTMYNDFFPEDDSPDNWQD